MLPIREQLSKSVLNNTQMEFDATSFTSFYPSAMWANDSVYPKIETGYTIKPHLNDVFVNDFYIQTFNQDGNDSASSEKSFTINRKFYLNIYQKTIKLKNYKLIEREKVMFMTR